LRLRHFLHRFRNTVTLVYTFYVAAAVTPRHPHPTRCRLRRLSPKAAPVIVAALRISALTDPVRFASTSRGRPPFLAAMLLFITPEIRFIPSGWDIFPHFKKEPPMC
jgi:hypothetical protein